MTKYCQVMSFVANIIRACPPRLLGNTAQMTASKSPVLLGSLIPFIITLAAYASWFASQTFDAPSWLKWVYVFWIITTADLWFWSYRNAFVSVLSAVESRKVIPDRSTIRGTHQLKVALLYLCCDDFDEGAVGTLLDQTYRNCLVYVLDDSHLQSNRRRIDQYCMNHQIEVIRRQTRKGYKPGALNNALRHLPQDIEVFAISDSDEKIPRDFVEKCVTILLSSDKTGFVQCRHLVVKQTSKFAQVLSQRMNSLWLFQQAYRNRYGLVQFQGHGAVLSRKVVEEVGGFPELLVEDFALTLDLSRAGYSGYFLKDVVCFEDFPPDYFALKTRNVRWATGDFQILFGVLPKFLLSSNVSFIEKFDGFASIVGLPMSLIFFFFWLTLPLAGLQNVLGFFRPDLAAVMGAAYFSPVLATMFYNIYSDGERARPSHQNYRDPLTYFLVGALLLPSGYIALLKAIWNYCRKRLSFDITPRQSKRLPLGEVARLGRVELLTGFLMLFYVLLFKALWDIPLILVAASFILSPFSSFLLGDRQETKV